MSALEAVTPLQNMPRKLPVTAPVSVSQTSNAPARHLLNQDAFNSMLYVERRRAERTQNHFVLVLVDVSSLNSEAHKVKRIAEELSEATRETDITGWYVENSLIGIIGTNLGNAPWKTIRERFLEKLRRVFHNAVGKDRTEGIFASFHFFPEEGGTKDNGHPVDETFHPELAEREEQKKVPRAVLTGKGAH